MEVLGRVLPAGTGFDLDTPTGSEPQEPVPVRAVRGYLASYDTEGIWFQDAELRRNNYVVFIRWNLIEAILSKITPAPSAKRRPIGFRGPGIGAD